MTPLSSRTPNERRQTTKSSPGGSREGYPTSGRLWDLSTNTNLPLWGGSRHRSVENYIFGSQPCVQKGTSTRGGDPQDVSAQAQPSIKVEGPTVSVEVEDDEVEVGVLKEVE